MKSSKEIITGVCVPEIKKIMYEKWSKIKGMTFLIKLILAKVRQRNEIALAVASL